MDSQDFARLERLGLAQRVRPTDSAGGHARTVTDPAVGGAWGSWRNAWPGGIPGATLGAYWTGLTVEEPVNADDAALHARLFPEETVVVYPLWSRRWLDGEPLAFYRSAQAASRYTATLYRVQRGSPEQRPWQGPLDPRLRVVPHYHANDGEALKLVERVSMERAWTTELRCDERGWRCTVRGLDTALVLVDRQARDPALSLAVCGALAALLDALEE